ncbi:elongator complex protein 6 isoform X2 [Narcine bancroftii]|uniref:elongator complex protein 6 isoform X2 n=1 Tax=Narcine bancroftii TaxID=1343680 RepID=UPI003831411B
MFHELNNILSSTPETCEQGISILLCDKQTDGGFLVHHFLSFYLKGGCKVCFLGLLQSFNHYTLVAQKLGINLPAAREKGQLVFLEGLRSSLDVLLGDEQDSLLQKSSPLQFLSSPSATLQPLYQFICAAVLETSETTRTWKFPVLIIDDLSVLLSLGVTTENILNFMHYCTATLCSKMKPHDGSLTFIDITLVLMLKNGNYRFQRLFSLIYQTENFVNGGIIIQLWPCPYPLLPQFILQFKINFSLSNFC